MNNALIEYPHPVLNADNNDFIDSYFAIEFTDEREDDKYIIVSLKVIVDCNGITEMINNKDLKVLAKVCCKKTSYRCVQEINLSKECEIRIPKDGVSDNVIVQGVIISNKNSVHYKLNEFNQRYFGEESFLLKKGDIVACSGEINIKLDIEFEKNLPSIVLVTFSEKIKELTINYAKVNEPKDQYKDYITIILPKEEFDEYEELRNKKIYKNNVSRILEASLIMPAVLEGISKLRYEETVESDSNDSCYNGTVWANSIYEALRKIGIEEISQSIYTDYELANKLLGNVEGDSINSMIKRMKDWTTLRMEE